METVQSLHCQGLQLKKVHYEEKKYDFVKNDHDSLGSLHNTDFEGKNRKKLHTFAWRFRQLWKKKIIYILSSTENLFSLL